METLHLYPTNLARDAALKLLPDAAWTHRHRTFAEFAADLDRLLPSPADDFAARREARGVGRHALLVLAAKSAALGELESIAGSERALDAAGALIASWKGASLRPDDVSAAAKELAARPAAARLSGIVSRLARLFELYERQLGKNWTDREGIERNLLKRLASAARIPPRLLKPGASVALHGFHKLAYVQYRIVEKLVQLKHEVVADAPALFCGEDDHVAKSFPNLSKTFGLAKFVGSIGTQSGPRIQRIEAPTPYAEVYEIGRRVRRWIVDEKIAPASICVAFRELGQYSQAIHDVFKRLGIPFYERRGEPAAFQPLVRTALCAVDACVEGLDRRGVFRFLCAGPVDSAALAGTEHTRLDAGELRALALDAGIDRFHGDAAENPAAAWKEKLKRFLSEDASKSGTRLRAFGRSGLALALGAIVERMNAMRADRTAFAHAQAWRAFFDVCGLNAARISIADGSSAALKERLALGALDAALRNVAEIPGAATETIPLRAFAELLNLAVQEQSVRADGTDRAGVRVLNFYDLRGLRFARLAIGGLAEGICPARPGADPLLGKGGEHALRAALEARVNDREAGAWLAPRLSSELDEEERALFEGAAASAENEILLARPQRDFDGAALGASEFWDEFAQPVEKTMPIHPAPQLADCLTAEEFELRAAWILGGGSGMNESALALAAFASAPRLKTLARQAAVERGRYRFFLDQAVAAAQTPAENTAAGTSNAAGVFDGIVAEMGGRVGGDAHTTFSSIAKRLAPRGVGDPMLGPSALEELAACPFRFFTQHVCGFDRAEEPGSEMSPLDAGELWHTVLNRFYKEELDRAASSGRLTARLDRRMRGAYVKRLVFFSGEELFNTVSKKFTGHPGFWKLQEERLPAFLGKWLDCELQEPSDGFFPARVEFEFGPESANGGHELTVPLIAGPKIQADPSNENVAALRIKGRMDRLDFKTETRGGVETVVAVRVIDYKHGRGTSYSEKTKPESMTLMLAAQLPIYVAAAVDYLFRLRDEGKIAVDFERVWKESRAGYYSLRDTPFSSRGIVDKLIEVKHWPLEDMRAFLDASAPGAGTLFDLARKHILETLNGRFPVQPLDCAGVYCPARYTCRFQAIPAMAEDE